MAEKKKRHQETEPPGTVYDRFRERKSNLIRLRKEGKRLVRFDDIPWVQSRQAFTKHYSNPVFEDELAAPGWSAFMQRIYQHSGRHIHQGGLAIYVVDGKGYSVVDGVRHDWKAGDLLILPIKPGGSEHQHFNENPDEPSHWIALIFQPWRDYVADETRQVDTHPNWAPT